MERVETLLKIEFDSEPVYGDNEIRLGFCQRKSVFSKVHWQIIAKAKFP